MPKTKITREEIIRAALKITRERGIEAATAKEIAKKLKCSIQPVYWVFECMENLRAAVITEANKEYTAYVFVKGYACFVKKGIA